MEQGDKDIHFLLLDGSEITDWHNYPGFAGSTCESSADDSATSLTTYGIAVIAVVSATLF